ncbi:MAG: hypothetical protein A2887_03010 [Alphaproteobacteria bacterium RIFCSPLOWO2_01_FULL_40_26]|nr:MAG: hypothetical protein A3D15_05600 [Alphaproteobacteria bacterium RIFCSPHIGHO2_02_FULL_40_34]OFW86615.1 MAG: hypothetical protein A2794_04280 [Alphaproteobacteria bacterium RIFCSPHIGHO2_01_FULL_40_8]OFW95494.1 MAG: hypothetical protein A2887_03010 [Alphaproteobacteria bacterium RIFCSPLOWO2_01_FULL_40_26]OFX09326.1 MAG: hypothetical protein A3H30_01320 [Alphaproteobacteria bacterium RIFCSPLOWO2_02_FULL_40_19]OFX10852.1 MAG: hypothetical protein A3G22_00300 [Alphaproteobacteria bacterium RI
MRYNLFKNLLKSCAFFLFLISQNSFAENYVSTTDIIKEIEKSLIFDKESRQKVDFYRKNGATKKSDFSIIKTETEGEKEENSPSSVQILAVDPKVDNFDFREKERLAYNAALIGQYEVAIQLYKQILDSEPDNSYVKFSLATVYQKIGQFRQAKTLYHQLLKSGYEDQNEVIGNLLAIMIEESPRDAIYLLSRLSIQNPKSPDILAHAAIAYDKIKNYDQAISLFKKAVVLDPNNLDYQYNLAVIYDKTGHHEEALDLYSNVAKNYSDNNQTIPLDQVQKRIQSIRNKL